MTIRYRHPHENAIPLSETLEGWILIGSIVLTVFLLQTDVLPNIIQSLGDAVFMSSFVTGLFFTSILTTAPSIVALAEIAQYAPAWQVALAGGVGAVIGDLFVFRFIRSRLVTDIVKAAFHPRAQRMGRAIARGPLWWLAPLVGAIVIASPLPDELGLLMMGLSHIRLVQFLPLTFVANILGIYAIALAAQSLS